MCLSQNLGNRGTRGTGRGAHERRTPAPRRAAAAARLPTRVARGGSLRSLESARAAVGCPVASPCVPRAPVLFFYVHRQLYMHMCKTLAACTNIAVPRPARGRSAVGPPASDSRDISTPTRRQSVSPWPPLHAAPPRRATANCRPNARRRARRAERRLLHLATTHSEQAAPPGRGGRER